MKDQLILLIILTILTLITLPISNSSAVEDFEVKSLEITLYRDGYAYIVQKIEVNETVPVISIKTLTSNVEEEFLIVLSDSKPLEYEYFNSNLTIYTLGATFVTIEYGTAELTKKEGEVWTFEVNLPYEATLTLPANASLVYFNEVPEEVTTADGRILLRLKPGFWEISYVLEIIYPTLPSQSKQQPAIISSNTGWLYILIIPVILAAALALFLIKGRRKVELDYREKRIVEFLSKIGGRALESEIRENLKLPRSTTWRILKRMEEKGLVRIRKVGLQNEVELKK